MKRLFKNMKSGGLSTDVDWREKSAKVRTFLAMLLVVLACFMAMFGFLLGLFEGVTFFPVDRSAGGLIYYSASPVGFLILMSINFLISIGFFIFVIGFIYKNRRSNSKNG